MRRVAALGAAARLAMAVTIAVAALAAAGSPAPVTDAKPPPDFLMPRADSSPGQVTFSHAAHLTKVTKCSACHMRDFKMKRGASGPVTLEAKQQGKFCGACHDGKTTMQGTLVFPIDECDRCHK